MTINECTVIYFPRKLYFPDSFQQVSVHLHTLSSTAPKLFKLI